MTESDARSTTEDRAARARRLAGLMERVGAGETEAFGPLYDEIAPVVHGTAIRVLRDPDHAAEVTQEVLVEIWRGAPRFDPGGGSVLGWVATIAHRRAVDRVRAVQAQRERDERAGIQEYDPPRDSVAEEAERRLVRQQVLGCLASLTDAQRTAVCSAYYDGYSYREVAERAGVALATMKSRIRDGLIRLRQCLEVQR
ncbi:MAG TPA: ECF RNA polymerase sigma factor SigK [Beutenbergiaceae bacterium]|nr:ECF RNA polymerase sigma factor SigK [Beutenbergiaceae bacterium]